MDILWKCTLTVYAELACKCSFFVFCFFLKLHQVKPCSEHLLASCDCLAAHKCIFFLSFIFDAIEYY